MGRMHQTVGDLGPLNVSETGQKNGNARIQASLENIARRDTLSEPKKVPSLLQTAGEVPPVESDNHVAAASLPVLSSVPTVATKVELQKETVCPDLPVSSTILIQLVWSGRVDIDLSAVLFDASKAVLSTAWFRNLKPKCGGVTHYGDNRAQNEEIIELELEAIPLEAHFIAFTATVYDYDISLNDVERLILSIKGGREPYLNHELAELVIEDARGSGMIMAALIRRGHRWDIQSLRQPAIGKCMTQLLRNPANFSWLENYTSTATEQRNISIRVMGLRDSFSIAIEFRGEIYISSPIEREGQPEWEWTPITLENVSEHSGRLISFQVFDDRGPSDMNVLGFTSIPVYGIASLPDGYHQMNITLEQMPNEESRRASTVEELILGLSLSSHL